MSQDENEAIHRSTVALDLLKEASSSGKVP
jgi:hypothetical protein